MFISKQRFVTMWILAIVVLVITGTCELTQANEFLDNIKSFCTDKWPIDFEMRKYCVDNQLEAIAAFMARVDAAPKTNHYTIDTSKQYTDEEMILGQCFGKWQDDKGRVDWEMAEYCAKNQMDAYNSLQ